MTGTGVRRRLRTASVASLALAVALGLAACDSDADPEPRPGPTSAAPVKKAKLTFGVYGSEDELASYQTMVDGYNATTDLAQVRLEPFTTHDALEAAVRAGGKGAPDLFMADRDDLTWIRDEERNAPVDELLDERGVEFGDRYSRAALEAFSEDRRLQCMPYSISPTVIFYNTKLVDFERMAARDLDVPPETNSRWTFEQFEEAARFASRKRRGTTGVYVAPTVRALAPFVLSGGGKLFDDEEDPTTLALSDEGSREALTRTLELLRDPTVTLTDEQLTRRSPREWFERGKLAMIEGDRSMVPELRAVPGLDFDVLPMPVLDGTATVGDITGTCITAGGPEIPAAAEFLVYALSTEAVAEVTRAGYIVPVNQEVALTDDFLQPGREPEHAGVFTSSVRSMTLLPLLEDWSQLELAVAPVLEELLTVPVLDDLEEITTRIDEASRTVLDPEGLAEEDGQESEDAEE